MSSAIRDLAVTSSLVLLQACSNVAGVEDADLADAIHDPQYASAPIIEKFHDDLTFAVVSCGGFAVIRHVVADGTFKTFFDNEGNPVRVAIHVNERNTLTNSVSGKSVEYPGILNISIDVPSGTQRVTGTPIHITVPHEGNVLSDAGILILDQDGNIIFEGGPHPFGPSGDPTVFCSLLA